MSLYTANVCSMNFRAADETRFSLLLDDKDYSRDLLCIRIFAVARLFYFYYVVRYIVLQHFLIFSFSIKCNPYCRLKRSHSTTRLRMQIHT